MPNITELRYELLTREKHVLYCGKRHHLYGKTIASLQTLSDEPLILTGADEPDNLTHYRLQHGLGKRTAATTPNLEEARRLTGLGLGICLLPKRMTAADVRRRTLWPLTPDALGVACDIFAATNKHAQKRIAAEIFVEELSQKVKQSAPETSESKVRRMRHTPRTATIDAPSK